MIGPILSAPSRRSQVPICLRAISGGSRLAVGAGGLGDLAGGLSRTGFGGDLVSWVSLFIV